MENSEQNRENYARFEQNEDLHIFSHNVSQGMNKKQTMTS
jgi:hypothetical protein